MSTERNSATERLNQIRTELEQEDRQSLFRAKVWVGLRVVLILIFAGYMTWIFGAVSKLDADQLTEIAANSIRDRLPQLRMDLRDYAIAMAPKLTDKAQDLLLELPGQVREQLEEKLTLKTDSWIARFETDLDDALTTIIDEQIELINAESPDATAEQQLDAIILGVAAIFNDTMTEAMDEMYLHYAEKLREVNGHLDHLLRSPSLTEQEKIDKQLIEAWMTLVHHHGITKETEASGNIQVGLVSGLE